MNRETAKQLFRVALAAAGKHQRNLGKAQFAAATRNTEAKARAFEIVARLEVTARETMNAAITAALQLGGHEIIPSLIAEAEAH